MSASSIVYRLRNLQKKVIKGYNIVFNKHKLGYNSYRVEIISNDLSKKDNIIQFLSKERAVTKISEFVGEMDLDFEADFVNSTELDEFLKKLRIKIPSIRDFEVINIVRD